jgi:hypothetical protein
MTHSVLWHQPRVSREAVPLSLRLFLPFSKKLRSQDRAETERNNSTEWAAELATKCEMGIRVLELLQFRADPPEP